MSPFVPVALHWRLLTTHCVAVFADARPIVSFYRRRWTIEQLFRVMKTQSFDIKAATMEDVTAFENLVAAVGCCRWCTNATGGPGDH
ncbi:MAG: transposase [Rhodopila sp.]|nr:transposase [Rhodopila sp.]